MHSITPARYRQRGMATGELGITATICFIAGVCVFQYYAAKQRGMMEQLQGLAAAVDAAKDEKKIACPDPGKIFTNAPYYSRETGRPWRLEQDLPAAESLPEIRRTASYLVASTNGPTTILEIRPKFWWRYLAGPAVILLGILYIISLFVNSKPGDRAPTGVIVVVLIAAVSFSLAGWHSLFSAEGSEVFELDSARGRVLHRRFVFGVERAQIVYEGCDGVALADTKSGRSIVLFHREGQGRVVTELVDGLDKDAAALGPWLRSRFRP